MPLNEAGQKVMANMKKEYGDERGERIFYALLNKKKKQGGKKPKWAPPKDWRK